MNWQEFNKYTPAFDYIIEFKPMHIIEYGGGQSTYFINQLLDELNYGGKVTAYENNPEFYEFSNSQNWNSHNSIKLTDLAFIDEKLGTLRYNHDVEEVLNVDFIIIDGPDYRLYDKYGITDNIEFLQEQFGRTIPFWIEGRSGCQHYYKGLNYKMITDYEV